eukprot:GILJ01014176.1.p1 GENE.GILJ01014176.1~~GILJ01014176.1.p1  ORF type:complete len:843 (-),score=95.28 GILJ01014176.1:154-2682(-)
MHPRSRKPAPGSIVKIGRKDTRVDSVDRTNHKETNNVRPLTIPKFEIDAPMRIKKSVVPQVHSSNSRVYHLSSASTPPPYKLVDDTERSSWRPQSPLSPSIRKAAADFEVKAKALQQRLDSVFSSVSSPPRSAPQHVQSLGKTLRKNSHAKANSEFHAAVTILKDFHLNVNPPSPLVTLRSELGVCSEQTTMGGVAGSVRQQIIAWMNNLPAEELNNERHMVQQFEEFIRNVNKDRFDLNSHTSAEHTSHIPSIATTTSLSSTTSSRVDSAVNTSPLNSSRYGLSAMRLAQLSDPEVISQAQIDELRVASYLQSPASKLLNELPALDLVTSAMDMQLDPASEWSTHSTSQGHRTNISPSPRRLRNSSTAPVTDEDPSLAIDRLERERNHLLQELNLLEDKELFALSGQLSSRLAIAPKQRKGRQMDEWTVEDDLPNGTEMATGTRGTVVPKSDAFSWDWQSEWEMIDQQYGVRNNSEELAEKPKLSAGRVHKAAMVTTEDSDFDVTVDDFLVAPYSATRSVLRRQQKSRDRSRSPGADSNVQEEERHSVDDVPAPTVDVGSLRQQKHNGHRPALHSHKQHSTSLVVADTHSVKESSLEDIAECVRKGKEQILRRHAKRATVSTTVTTPQSVATISGEFIHPKHQQGVDGESRMEVEDHSMPEDTSTSNYGPTHQDVNIDTKTDSTSALEHDPLASFASADTASPPSVRVSSPSQQDEREGNEAKPMEASYSPSSRGGDLASAETSSIDSPSSRRSLLPYKSRKVSRQSAPSLRTSTELLQESFDRYQRRQTDIKKKSLRPPSPMPISEAIQTLKREKRRISAQRGLKERPHPPEMQPPHTPS